VPFDNLKKQLDPYTASLLGTGNTLAQGVQSGLKEIESGPAVYKAPDESIDPDYNSPIDFIANIGGAKLGTALARKAMPEAVSLGSLVNSSLQKNPDVNAIRGKVTDYLGKHFKDASSVSQQPEYLQQLYGKITAPAQQPIDLVSAIEGTPTNLDQAIANAIKAKDSEHVKDYLAQKFTAAEFQKPDGEDVLGLFNNIVNGSKNTPFSQLKDKFKKKLGGQ
jgi:homoserine kinase